MILLGNYIDYIDNEWLEYINKDNTGVPTPRDSPAHKLNNPIYGKWDQTKVYGIIYDYQDNGHPLKVTQPPWTNETYFHWFVKHMPSMLSPTHIDNSPYDPITDTRRTVYNRYVVFLQDYIEGHIFIYNDKLITGYSKGDVYKFADVGASITEGNSGHSIKITLNITAWNE
jgi:hypothetical protein